ncbi:hypothetical protein AHAS_Ahas15G0077800 [Arachis hypogaea]
MHILKTAKNFFSIYMPFGLFKIKPHSGYYQFHSLIGKYCCIILRINVDCNACCQKLRRIILRMKGKRIVLIKEKIDIKNRKSMHK